ncbi:MAG TPA: 16S rRNA (uracil(1498)-N(3))-methyltransferase [Stellaceae bacterium]|nr:16S rRNA (uracil(1498)-N(3))-methyltransferase [Stellaceae bacterium]
MTTEPSASRVYVAGQLAEGGVLTVTKAQAHHLRVVLRLSAGSPVAAFNGADGEWLCRIAAWAKGGAQLAVERRLRAPMAEPELSLLFAPLRRSRLDWLVEKATELGVSELLPVTTVRTQIARLNPGRLHAVAVAAAEQSERLSLPAIRPVERLDGVLDRWPVSRPLIVCDESGGGEPIVAAAMRLRTGPAALLIGPEGGFAQSELDAFGKLSFVSRVGLGPRVLRAETAALAGLAVLQAIAGDWRSTRPR